MLRLIIMATLFTLIYLTMPQADAGVLSTLNKAAKTASKAAEVAAKAAAATSKQKKMTTSTGETSPNVGIPGLANLLSPNGFFILNSAIQNSRLARDTIREKTKCKNKMRIKSSVTVFESANITSPKRLNFIDGEIVCIKSKKEGWVETWFGWVPAK